MGNVVRMWKDRLEPREIPKKFDPRPTSETIETLLREIAVGDIVVVDERGSVPSFMPRGLDRFDGEREGK